ncbi:MAG: sel1 repeat family protein [Holosporales bacterium]|jgi:TPR repeat protein|nr:sel1 repeat family protein [Holosporales bacterium]
MEQNKTKIASKTTSSKTRTTSSKTREEKIAPTPINEEKATSPEVDDIILQAEKYYSGAGVKKDIKKSLDLFRKAAQNGSGYACKRLGLEYSDFALDDLTPRNNKVAREWFEKGSKLGDAESTFYLSQFVFEGWGGEKDEKKATELLISAAHAKSKSAAHRVIKLSKKGNIKISDEDKRNFYALDKEFGDNARRK